MSSTLEEHAQEIKTQGYTIIENVLDRAQIESARTAIDEIFEREKEIASQRDWRNRSHISALMLLQKDRRFRSVYQEPRVLSIMQMLLGDDCVLSSLNGLTMMPHGEPQKLHKDSLGIPGAVLTVNALYTIDDFTRENGCTRVVPSSQDWVLDALGLEHNLDVLQFEESATYLEAPAGSVIAYNGSIMHGGSRNTTDKFRRALHAFYVRSWICPQWDFALSLSADVINELTEDEKKLLGFNTRPMRYNYKTDEVIFGLPKPVKPPGLLQRARNCKSWILKQGRRLIGS